MTVDSPDGSRVSTTYQDLEARLAREVAHWPDVHALVIVGSRARTDHTADAWSDLDLIMFCVDTSIYRDDTGWLALLGEPRLILLEHPDHPQPEWFVLLPGGLRVDIMLVQVPVEAGDAVSLSHLLAAFPYQNVLRRGVRILFARTETEPSAPGEPLGDFQPQHPSAAAFQDLASRMFFEALRSAKLLARGDLWRAKQSCDCASKALLLTMLEWHTRALHGLEHDVWYDGRFLERWAEPDVAAVLPQTFATYDTADIQRALQATLSVFGHVGRTTAAQLGYTYPVASEQQILADIAEMLEGA